MLKRSLWFWLIGVLLVVALMAAACGGEEPATTTSEGADTTGPSEPIKIGVIGSLTGIAAPGQKSLLSAVELEVQAANDAGGVNGRPIELVILDDQSDPSLAVANMTKLITEDNVTAVMGPLQTPCAAAVVPLADKYEVPLLRWDTPSLSEPDSGSKWAFFCSDGPVDVANALLQQIKAEGWKNILAVADVLPPNSDALTLLKDQVASAGATMTLMTDTWSLTDTDVTPIINKIVEEYKRVQPDVVFCLSTIMQTTVFYKGLRSMGVTVPIQTGAVSAHPSIIIGMGPEAVEGLLLLGCGLINTEQLPDDYVGRDVMTEFAARFKAAKGEVPTLFAAAGYDSFHILLNALKVAGDDKAKIRDAIENTKNFTGCQGVFTYSADNHQGLTGGYSEWMITNGEFTFVRALN